MTVCKALPQEGNSGDLPVPWMRKSWLPSLTAEAPTGMGRSAHLKATRLERTGQDRGRAGVVKGTRMVSTEESQEEGWLRKWEM